MNRPVSISALVLLLLACGAVRAGPDIPAPRPLHELDNEPVPPADRVPAIVGAVLVDGTGGPAVPDSAVIVRGDRIVAAGPRAAVAVPAGADVVDAAGL